MAVQPHGLVNLINDALAWVRLVSGSIAAVQKFREISNDTSPPSFPRTKCQDLVFLYPLLILERAAFLLFSPPPPTIFIDPWCHSVNFYRSVSKIAADRVYSLKSRPALEKDVSNREDIKGGNGEWSYGKGTIATEWLTGTDSLSPSLLSDFLSISVLFSPALSLSPLRFHVLHLHVKLDWLQENWTVSHRNIRCLLPRILASPSPPSWYTQSVQTWPWRVVARIHPPVAACPDTRARVHQWYLHISNYFEEDAKWSVASVQWTDLPFIFVASFLRSPFSSAPATASLPPHYVPFFRRRFAFVLSYKYMSAHRCRGIDPSILSQLHSPVVPPVSKELTGGVSPWQTEPIGKRSASFLLFILLFSSIPPPRILLISDYRRIFAAGLVAVAIGLTCWWLEVFGEYQFHSIRVVREIKSRISYFFFPEARGEKTNAL